MVRVELTKANDKSDKVIVAIDQTSGSVILTMTQNTDLDHPYMSIVGLDMEQANNLRLLLEEYHKVLFQ